MIALKPPIGLSSSVMSPPWLRAMSRAIDRPSPVPPSSWLRAAIEPEERPEHILAPVGGDARPVVVDGDGQPAARVGRLDVDLLGIAEGVADDVAEQAREGMRPHLHLRSPAD